jgi:nucleoside-diphosphate-sugar epimerase
VRVIPRLLAGKSARVLGSLDQPHSWTYVEDVATTLVECARRPEAWGRVWHVATNAPRTQRQILDDLCDAAGVDRVRSNTAPPVLIRLLGLFSPTVRELPHTLYQFTAPFIIDDSATRAELQLAPTPWGEVLRETINEYRQPPAS